MNQSFHYRYEISNRRNIAPYKEIGDDRSSQMSFAQGIFHLENYTDCSVSGETLQYRLEESVSHRRSLLDRLHNCLLIYCHKTVYFLI